MIWRALPSLKTTKTKGTLRTKANIRIVSALQPCRNWAVRRYIVSRVPPLEQLKTSPTTISLYYAVGAQSAVTKKKKQFDTIPRVVHKNGLHYFSKVIYIIVATLKYAVYFPGRLRGGHMYSNYTTLTTREALSWAQTVSDQRCNGEKDVLHA